MFIQNGGEEEKKNKNESSPIQLGEGTSTLRQGFIQEGLSPSLDERKSHSSSACVMHFVLCTDVCASLCMQQVNWKVCLSYIWSTQLHLSLAAREVAFFFPYFFIHSFLFFFSPNISPRLPSSHPNQRTHRPLLGTPCPGNPPCTARYRQCLQSP